MSFLADLWAWHIYWHSDIRWLYASEEDWRAAMNRDLERLR